MKLPFQLCLLIAGTLLILSPVIYKVVVTITLAIVVVKEHRADMAIGPVEPYLAFCVISGIVMVSLAIISNSRNKT